MTSPLNRRTLLLGVVPAAALGLSACGSSSSQPSVSASASGSASASATSASASASATASASASADSSASVSGSATADDGYVGYRLNREVPGAGTATLYTDYQCPYCAKAEPKFEEAAKKLDGIMNVTVRHMPLNMHANAVPAVEAATAQGKHVEMANKLFNTQNDWKNIKERDKLRTLFNDYAKELGLNVEEFDKVLLASDTVKPVQRDYEHAVKIGVKGTPTFAVNDKVVEGLDSSSSVDDLVSTFKREAGVK